MKGNLEPNQFDTRFLATVIAIIVLSLAALAWGWRSAHTSATKPGASSSWSHGNEEHEVRAMMPPASPPTASRNE